MLVTGNGLFFFLEERSGLLQDNFGAVLGASRWEDTSLLDSGMCFCGLTAAVFVPGMRVCRAYNLT